MRRTNQSHKRRRQILTIPPVFALLLLALAASVHAQARRLVVLKVDGLPQDTVDRFVRQRDPRTGKSVLPWFDHTFYQNGTRIQNFYTRGISLSAPSWSLIDTGQHLHIKGNVEFDRDTQDSYDYLDVFEYILKHIAWDNVDTLGAEVLDSLGVPLLADAYDKDERLVGMQLYQRGSRLWVFPRSGQQKFLRHPRETVEEYVTGFEFRNTVGNQIERELEAKLSDSQISYLDLLDASFDHMAHQSNDRESQLHALQEIDALIGRVWVAIQRSPLAAETALVVVSDHGTNSVEDVYSQGFNLVRLLGSAAGGGHHLVTERRLLVDYAIKGIVPPMWPVITTSPDSYYLKSQSSEYPTALLDFDGNERAGLHFRNSDLNLLHILLLQLQRKDVSPQLRRALTESFFDALNRDRSRWQGELDQLGEELEAFRRMAAKQKAQWEARPKKLSQEDKNQGREEDLLRLHARVIQWDLWEPRYTNYLATMRNLLSLRPESFDPLKLKIDQLIPKGAMGARNSIHDLQNYVVGLAPNGPVLKSDGSLDEERSFVRLNYFELLESQTVRNNVQQEVSHQPIDFVSTRISREAIAPALSGDLQPDDDVVWIYGGPARQALILARGESSGHLLLRYLPIANLRQDASGTIRFEQLEWQAGLPLRILEDQRLNVPEDSKTEWLNQWHTDLEWLQALHQTQYSNGLVGIHEQFTMFPAPGTDTSVPGLSVDERLLRRFWDRKRRLVEADIMINASDHWNFDVRGFNPGGNHGSFLRISTHSTLMFAGGERTGIPRGLVVKEPYDNLSVAPTLLALTGKLQSDGSVPDALLRRGFRKFPGRVIPEVVGSSSTRRPQMGSPAGVGP
jgi:hypothetical protein